MAGSARIDELKRRYEENPRRYFVPLANEYRKAGEPERAISLCRAQLPEQPGHISGNIVHAQALFDVGQLDDAWRGFATALQFDPENLIALRYCGDIARARGEPESARAWYRRLLEVDPRNADAHALLRDLGDAPPPPPPAPEAESEPEPVADAFDDPADLEPMEAPVAFGYDAPAADPWRNAPAAYGRSFDGPTGGEDDEPPFDAVDVDVDMPRRGAPPTGHDHARFDTIAHEAGAGASARFSSLESTAPVRSGASDAVPSAETFAPVAPVAPESGAPDVDPLAPAEPEPDPAPGGPDAPLFDSVWDQAPAASATPEPIAPPEPVIEDVIEEPSVAPAAPAAAVAGALDGTLPPAFVTATMAELYLQQGFRAQALAVYRELLTRNPGDAPLQARVRALCGEPADIAPVAAGAEPVDVERAVADAAPLEEPPAAAYPEWEPEPVQTPGAPTIRDLLASLAARRPPSRPAVPVVSSEPVASTPPEPEPLTAEPDAWPAADSVEEPEPVETVADPEPQPAAAYGPPLDGEPDPLDDEDAAQSVAGRPTRAAESELSLDRIFRGSGPAGSRPPSGSYSFDQFFAEAPTADLPPASQHGIREHDDRTSDIEQFNAWLDGLKKK